MIFFIPVVFHLSHPADGQHAGFGIKRPRNIVAVRTAIAGACFRRGSNRQNIRDPRKSPAAGAVPNSRRMHNRPARI